MSAKWKKSSHNREYKIMQKNYKSYCVVCNRRAGIFNAYCGPSNKKRNKNWKSYRETQWKQQDVEAV